MTLGPSVESLRTDVLVKLDSCSYYSERTLIMEARLDNDLLHNHSGANVDESRQEEVKSFPWAYQSNE